MEFAYGNGTPEWSIVGGLAFFPLLSQGAVFCSPFPMPGERLDGQVSESAVQSCGIGTSRAHDVSLLPSVTLDLETFRHPSPRSRYPHALCTLTGR